MSPWPLPYQYNPHISPKLDMNMHTYDHALETYYLASIFITEEAAGDGAMTGT